MTEQELIDAVAARAELTKTNAALVVDGVFDAMIQTLQRGESVELRGFGSFTVRHYRSYSGQNPKTGDRIQVAAKRLPFFKAGRELRAIVDVGRDRPISDGHGETDSTDE